MSTPSRFRRLRPLNTPAKNTPMKATLAALALSVSVAACSPEFQKDKMGPIIKDYLMNNPEVVRDALIKLQEQEEQEKYAALSEAIASESEALFNDPRDFAVGPKDAKVQVVEFYDYKCGYCRTAAPEVAAMIENNPDVRFVFKELPVLGGKGSPSYTMALASSAAARQDEGFLDFHQKLFETPPNSDEQLFALAKDAGLDVQRLKADMKDPAHVERFDATFRLAQKVGASGTPTFIIGDQIVPGWSPERIQKAMEEAKAEAAN